MIRQLLLVATLLAPAALIASTPVPQQTGQSAQDWPFGPYQVVANWPKPLPDKLHSHDGWTWGSMGSVYAETPDSHGLPRSRTNILPAPSNRLSSPELFTPSHKDSRRYACTATGTAPNAPPGCGSWAEFLPYWISSFG